MSKKNNIAAKRQFHITSFFQTGLTPEQSADYRKRLFEAEDERDRKRLEVCIYIYFKKYHVVFKFFFLICWRNF